MRIPQNENVNLNVNNNNAAAAAAAANNNQNPNNNNENNNNAPVNANRNGYEPVPQEAPASSNTDSSSESSSEVNEQQASSATAEETASRNRQVADTTAQPVQERLSPIALTILAIRTFFLSLVPDQPVLWWDIPTCVYKSRNRILYYNKEEILISKNQQKRKWKIIRVFINFQCCYYLYLNPEINAHVIPLPGLCMRLAYALRNYPDN